MFYNLERNPEILNISILRMVNWIPFLPDHISPNFILDWL